MAYDLNLGGGNVARMEPELYEVDASLELGPDALDTRSACWLCGELVAEHEQAEMYDPRRPELGAGYCHAECGLQAGWEVA